MLQHPIFAIGLPHGAEWLYILLIVIVLFRGEQAAATRARLGKSLGEFKKAKDEFEKEIHTAANEPDTKP